ncbi:MAG: hypothetical protein DWQ37_13010 [Planctomycetota bacterium]|nr:MAG: hypothetical protein DWQ37_13010 [Planctomycetota bacterium]
MDDAPDAARADSEEAAAARPEFSDAELLAPYDRRPRTLGMVSCTLVEWVVLLVLIFAYDQRFGGPGAPRGWAGLGQFVVLFLTMMGFLAAALFPLHVLFRYVLERRAGNLSVAPVAWLLRVIGYTLASVVLSLFIYGFFYGLIWTIGAWWWLVPPGAALIWILFMALAVPDNLMKRAMKIERRDLLERLARLAAPFRLPIRGIYELRGDGYMDAMRLLLVATGRDGRDVLLSGKALDDSTPEEIDVLFSYELVNAVHYYLARRASIQTLLAVARYAAAAWLLGIAARHLYGPMAYADMPPASVPLLTLLIALCKVPTEFVSYLWQLRWQRKCDRFALARSGTRRTFLTVLRKSTAARQPEYSLWQRVFVDPSPAERLAAAEAGLTRSRPQGAAPA